MSTSRREFLGSVAAVGALAALGTRARAQGAAKPAATKGLPFTISLAEWSYHNALHKGDLDHRDFTKTAKETHKIDAAEFVNTFFKDKARDAEYVKDLRKRADDLGVIAEMATDVAVMYLGRVVEQAPVDDIFHAPRHPYTQALLRSIPRMRSRSRERLNPIAGAVPHPYDRPAGCPFHPRCPQFMPGRCDVEEPTLRPVGDNHTVSCFLYP